RAISRPREPVGMALTFTFGESPNFIIDPSPNLVCIALRVSESTASPIVFSSFFSFFFTILLFINYLIIFLIDKSKLILRLDIDYIISWQERNCFVEVSLLVDRNFPAVQG